MGQYYNLHIDYCELRIPDMSIYWVVGGIGIKLMQYHMYMKKAHTTMCFHSKLLTSDK